MSSANIDTEPEPAKIRWSTSPSAAEGLRAKEGDLAEEGDVVQLGPGSDLVYLFRTFDGFLGVASYIDGEWKDRQRALRLLDGSALKQPNGPLAPRRFVDTEDNSVYYLLMFYNRGLPTAVHSNGTNPVSLPNAAWGSRNPYWLAAGWSDGVSNTTIVWSEPEVVLYSHTIKECTYRSKRQLPLVLPHQLRDVAALVELQRQPSLVVEALVVAARAVHHHVAVPQVRHPDLAAITVRKLGYTSSESHCSTHNSPSPCPPPSPSTSLPRCLPFLCLCLPASLSRCISRSLHTLFRFGDHVAIQTLFSDPKVWAQVQTNESPTWATNVC